MAVDFSSLLAKPAGEAKKPPALNSGEYPGIIKQYEVGDNNKNRTPYVRVHVGITGWPGEPQTGEDGKPIDLSKKQMRKDYYLTDDSLWRLDEFLRALGIEMAAGETYAQVLPNLVGIPVMLDIKQELNQNTNDVFNVLDTISAAK